MKTKLLLGAIFLLFCSQTIVLGDDATEEYPYQSMTGTIITNMI